MTTQWPSGTVYSLCPPSLIQQVQEVKYSFHNDMFLIKWSYADVCACVWMSTSMWYFGKHPCALLKAWGDQCISNDVCFSTCALSFIGIVFYYHYKRAWLKDMERDASQPLLWGQNYYDKSLICTNQYLRWVLPQKQDLYYVKCIATTEKSCSCFISSPPFLGGSV